MENGSSKARTGCMFEVKADGDWTITVSTITNATTRAMTGTGDKVTVLFTLPNTTNVVTLNHAGNRNFIVWRRYSDGTSKNLANEIGSYSRQVVLKAKANCTYYLDIESDGTWTIDMGYGETPTLIADIN